jgi:hypothetical protein
MGKIFPYRILIPLALLMAVLPISPEPHLLQKLRMLSEGALTRPIDIFDLFWHSWPMLVIGIRVIAEYRKRKNS